MYNFVDYYNGSCKLFSGVRNTFWMWGHKIFVHILSYETEFFGARDFNSTADRTTQWNVKYHVLRELVMLTMAPGHSMVSIHICLWSCFCFYFINESMHIAKNNELVLKDLQQNRTAPCHICLQFLTHTSEARAWKSFDSSF